jgi:hypothetical protein
MSGKYLARRRDEMSGENTSKEDETKQNLGWLWGMGLGILIAATIWFVLMAMRTPPPT